MDDILTLADADVMRRAQAGDAAAFAELARRYQGALVRVAASRLGRADWGEEAAQETLMAALRSRHTYDPSRGFRTWLWTILLNQCTAVRRRRTRENRVRNWTDRAAADERLTIDRLAVAPGGSPLAALLAKERAEQLDALLGRLTDVQADALRLRFFAGLKFSEIADAMDCSLLTAKNRVKFGLVRLSQMLQEP